MKKFLPFRLLTAFHLKSARKRGIVLKGDVKRQIAFEIHQVLIT